MKRFVLIAMVAAQSMWAYPAAADYTLDFMGTCAGTECVAAGVDLFQCFEKKVGDATCSTKNGTVCTVTVYCKTKTP